ncbi:MAG: S8 family serine peptidase, partial [Candidatus Omnitrophica bacterium]|nr:S8 family serine peptidase [Candidatus Omnitrophota bacterium]
DGRTYFNFLKQAVDGYTNHTPYFLTNFNRWKAANPNQVVSSFSTTTNESTTHFQHGTEHLAERHEAETWEDAAANAFGNIMLGEQVEGLQNQLAESQRQLQSLIKKYGANHEGTAPARRILQSTIDSTKKQLDDLGAPQVAPAHPTYNSPDNYQPSFRAHPIPEADRAKIREQIQNFYGSNQVTPTNNQTGFPGIFSQNVFDNPGILNQDFSATTKLDGTDTVFGDRVRLNFDTSFTGEDRLRTRLDSGSTNAFNSFGNESAFNDPIGSYQNFNGAFNPSAVTALRLGMGPGDNAHLAGILNSTLSCRRTGYGSDCFEVLVKCKVYIYVTEEGIIYVVADKNKEAAEITPNDPYYLKQEEKKKKLLGIFGSSKKAEKPVFGLGMKFGTGTMGDGESYDSANKKEPTAVDQWGLHAIGYLPKDDPNSAWNLVGNVDINKKNITIAVIDSGLDTTHPDGPTHVWTNKNEIPNNGIDDDHNGYIDDVHGWNFLEENNDLTDYKGHGTFVSGIIAAKANNGIGIAGINPGAEIMPLKVTNEEGE